MYEEPAVIVPRFIFAFTTPPETMLYNTTFFPSILNVPAPVKFDTPSKYIPRALSPFKFKVISDKFISEFFA